MSKTMTRDAILAAEGIDGLTGQYSDAVHVIMPPRGELFVMEYLGGDVCYSVGGGGGAGVVVQAVALGTNGKAADSTMGGGGGGSLGQAGGTSFAALAAHGRSGA